MMKVGCINPPSLGEPTASLRRHYLLPGGARRALRSVRAWQFWAISPLLRSYLLAILVLTASAAGVAVARTHDHPL